MMAVRLSALRTGRPYPQEIFLVLISVRGWVDPQGQSAAGRIMSMKNSSDTIGNRTHDLLACSTVPETTAPPRAPFFSLSLLNKGLYVVKYSEVGGQVESMTDNCWPKNLKRRNHLEETVEDGRDMANVTYGMGCALYWCGRTHGR
jgi:hypothetical protein